MKWLRMLGVVCATLFCMAVFVVFAVEWMVGCGETYIDAKGVRHVNDCVFIR